MRLSIWIKGLRGRLVAIIAIALFTNIAINAATYYGMKNVDTNINNITEIRMPSIKGLEQMNEGQTAVLQVVGLLHKTTDVSQIAKLMQRYESKRAQVTAGYKLYEPLPQSDDEAKEWSEVTVKVWKNWEDSVDKYVEAKSKSKDNLEQLYQEQIQSFGPAEDSLSKIIEINYKNAGIDKAAAQSSMTKMLNFSLFAGILSSVGILILGLWIASKTAKSLNNLADALYESSRQVSAAANQISSASQELSQSTTEQAAGLQQTTAALEEMSSMVGKSSDNAERTASTSNGSRDKATAGKSVVTKMIHSIDDIQASNQQIAKQVEESNAQLTEIVRVIKEIGEKTKVINDIVFQTKLLSFNASVEAARAGEQGKGFSVVAEEVGKLAQMSGNASKEISTLLSGSIQKVEGIVTDTKTRVGVLVDKGQEKVGVGNQIAKECGQVLEAIVGEVNIVSSLAGEISVASREQTSGIQEITKAMNQLDQVTQQNAATSEQTASAAEELSAQAASLNSAIAELIMVIDGEAKNRAA